MRFALTGRAKPAERLWALLTRALPRSVVAQPATLLAVCVYLRGEGTLAHIAIDKALAADPSLRLAETVRAFLGNAWTPEKFWPVLADAAQGAGEAKEDMDVESCEFN